MEKLNLDTIKNKCEQFSGWRYDEATVHLEKEFSFKTYYKTLSFVQAVGWEAQKQQHHPDMTVSYGKCVIRMQTHDVGGISEKDFQLIEKIEQLIN